MKAAKDRAAKLGLNAVDAVHLEAAITAGAQEFYTTEKPTKPLFRETALKVIAI
jgi:predicted nucleic acid-binding protein